MDTNEFHTIPVHVVNQPADKRTRYRTTFRQMVLTPGDAWQLLLPPSELRYVAHVQALDDDVILAATQSDAQNGVGMRLPKANTAPWPVYESGDVYVAVPTFAGATSRVSMTVVYRTFE